MTFSGVNGSNCIPIGMAKVRVESGLFTHAKVFGSKGEYRIKFVNPESIWNGESLVLSSTRDIHNPKVFKSLDGAIADLKRLGIEEVTCDKSVLI
ncbi:hypothetical protein AB4428_01515 [Vibrio lentus]